MRQGRKPTLGDNLTREDRARIKVEVALMERGFGFSGFEKPKHGAGIIAVAIDGEKVLMHLGRDEADAMFSLAALASRP